MGRKFKTPLDAAKWEARKAAKDLGYRKDIFEEIENAKTEGELTRLMINARKERFG